MIIAHTLGLWFIYIVVMRLKRAEVALRKRGGTVLFLAKLLAAAGLLLDVLYNVTWGSLMFLQWPHWSRLTLTARLKYLQRGGGRWKWQGDLADFVCTKMLDPYDPRGKHC